MSGILVNVLNSVPVLGGKFGFRPPNWSQPQLTSLTANVPQPRPNTPGAFISSSPVTYFFDAVLRVDHEQYLRTTEHPIQSGASIVDHAYLVPARVTLEVAMSDAMATFDSGAYTSLPSKSVSFFQAMQNLQQLRIPIKLATRLKLYSNMLIENIRAFDDLRTAYGFRGTLYLKQIVIARVDAQTVSARPNQSNSTNTGTVQPQPIGGGSLQGLLDTLINTK